MAHTDTENTALPSRYPKASALLAIALLGALWLGFLYDTPSVCAQCTSYFQANGITFIGGQAAANTASLPNSNFNYYQYCTVFLPTTGVQTSPRSITWTTTLQTTLFRQTWICNYDGATDTYFPVNCTWQTNITAFWRHAPQCTLAASPNTAINPGEQVQLTSTCGVGTSAATSYSWTNASFSSTAPSGNVNPTTTTTYSVQGSNAYGSGNTSSVTVTVNQPAVPVCSLTASPTTINLGESSDLTSSCTPAATSYAWTNTGFNSAASGGSVSPTATTNYSVIGHNTAGDGTSASATVTVRALTEVTNGTRLNASALSLNRATGKYSGTITVTNTGSTALTGPVYVFFTLPQGVTLPALATSGGLPYLSIAGGLAAGATTNPVTITFTNPTNTRIAYTTRRYTSGN